MGRLLRQVRVVEVQIADQGAEGAGQAVQDAAIDFVDNVGGQAFVTERLRIGGEAIGNHGGSPSQTERAQTKLYHTSNGRRTAILLWYLDTDQPWSWYMTAKYVTVTIAERFATVTLNNPPSNL